jgi:hypothetical protein
LSLARDNFTENTIYILHVGLLLSSAQISLHLCLQDYLLLGNYANSTYFVFLVRKIVSS